MRVFLLCFESNAIQSTKMDRYDADYATNNANDLGYIYNRFSILLGTNYSSSMQRYNFKP